MDEKKSWDDIPSLEGLSVDWDYTTQDKIDNRSYSRLDAGSLQQLFETGTIPAKLAIAGETLRVLDEAPHPPGAIRSEEDAHGP